MALWKLILSYDGTGYNGWQVQPGLPTVQGTLAVALAQITGETVLPQGSGRTDAGVHALGQVASFQLASAIPADNLQHALNRALPPSIRVLSAEVAAPGFHARHSACGKTYEYRLFERRISAHEPERVCPPFLAPYVWDCRWPLALQPMQQASALLVGRHDFTSFAAVDPDLAARSLNELSSRPELRSGGAEIPASFETRNLIKTVRTFHLLHENGLLIFRITGSGFLHHMVRNLVGTLVEIGRGAMTVQEVPHILVARDRTLAGPTAPASGLFLISVDYGPPSAPEEPQP